MKAQWVWHGWQGHEHEQQACRKLGLEAGFQAAADLSSPNLWVQAGKRHDQAQWRPCKATAFAASSWKQGLR